MESKLPAGLQDDTGSQRRYRRCKVALDALIWPIESDFEQEEIDSHRSVATRVFVEDLSLTGAFLISARSFPPDSEFWARMRLGAHDILLEVVIRRVEEVTISERNCYGFGAQFIRGETMAEALPIIADYVDKMRKIEQKAFKKAA